VNNINERSFIPPLIGFLLGVASTAAYNGIDWLFGRALNPLKIDEPAPGDVLKEPLQFAPGCISYLVKGTLRRLPKNHTIWLLKKDPSSAQVKPQGFQQGRVILRNGKWQGRVYPSMAYAKRTTIIAVVAPPAVDMFFNYWQKVGLKAGWVPIDHIPNECRKIETVQARLP
jgi:hypothetical protein